jgi:hypothetical protein
MESSNPGGDLKRGGEAAAEPGPDGSLGSYLRWYAPTVSVSAPPFLHDRDDSIYNVNRLIN